MVIPPVIGDRVVVRFRLEEGAPADWRNHPEASLSDVTGILRADADPITVERKGELVTVPRRLIESMRLLSIRPVRNSEIRSLEYAAARAWPGIDHEWIHGWYVRAGGGFTRRANSAIPLDHGPAVSLRSLDTLHDWYSQRGLRGRIVVVDRLIPGTSVPREELSSPVTVLTRSLNRNNDDAGGPTGELRSHHAELAAFADDAWLGAYAAANQSDHAGDTDLVRDVLEATDGGSKCFAAIRHNGEAVSIGRGAVTAGADGQLWLGISAVWTAPSQRGQGLAQALLDALMCWGRQRSATAVYLQVEAQNTAAGTLYRRIGFGLHHTYAYRDLFGAT